MDIFPFGSTVWSFYSSTSKQVLTFQLWLWKVYGEAGD